ncbi:MAG: IPT/TIG domain-containing protein [Actinomycetota bacterium]|nr:IPT/TIG domain-containing protein [Actinomycetota bacterium]
MQADIRQKCRAFLAALLVLALVAFSSVLAVTGAGASGEAGELRSRLEEGNVRAAEESGHGLGFLPAPPGDYRELSPVYGANTLAASADLSGGMPPVGDQGAQNSCVSWAAAYYYKSWWEGVKHPTWDLEDTWYQFSPSFVYNQVNGGVDQGSNFPDTFQLLQNEGCTDIAQMPYDQGDYTTKPDSVQLQAAKPYRIPAGWGYFWIRYVYGPYFPGNPIEDVKAWLDAGIPAVMGIPIYSDFPDFRGNPPAQYYVYDGASGIEGGHGVCIVGYDDNINPGGPDPDHQGGFLMVNSWGPGWNGSDQGYIYLSYDFVRRYVWEAWSMVDNNSDAPVIGDSALSGEPGEPVDISGDNFGVDRREVEVTFDGVSASIDSYGDQGITARVPAGVTEGPVVVYNWDHAASNAVPFKAQPHLDGLGTDSGFVGDEVVLEGYNFGDDRAGGNSSASFGGVEAQEYLSWSDTYIRVKVPRGVMGEVEVSVSVDGLGASNALPFEAVPRGLGFAEGYTGEGFQEFLCLGNDQAYDVEARVLYLFPDSTYMERQVTVPSRARVTLNVNGDVGPGREVSALIFTDLEIVAERPMYFDYRGAWRGGHDAMASPYTSKQWFFAEGYTGAGFDEWICVLNPGDEEADLNFHFQTVEEGEITVTGSVPPASRRSFRVNDILGPGYQCSLALESDQYVLAERSMYFDYGGTGGHHWQGGHCVMGLPAPAGEFYFAEGTTRDGFEEWITLQNPNPSSITVAATYQLGPGQGPAVSESYTIPPLSRYTVYVADEVGEEKDVSVTMTSGSPFLAERPMYFDYRGFGVSRQGGHCVIGAVEAATGWFFAEGCTGGGFHEWLCLQNPGVEDSRLEISFLDQGGSGTVNSVDVPAGTRVTVWVNGEAGSGRDLCSSIEVVSGSPVVAERPMYFDYYGCGGGHDVVGFSPSSNPVSPLVSGAPGDGLKDVGNSWYTLRSPREAATPDPQR